MSHFSFRLKEALKKSNENNPVMVQRFGADPYALVYDGRVYLYMTGDSFIYDENGEITVNTFANINTINVISSEDLVNWTDHGTIYAAGKEGAATWGNNSWAPAAAYKIIDGKPKFFLYFANSGNGIAVLESDSPVGPFKDPIGGPLISRQTPTCAEVTWLFDPAVLMDDDGECYIYFGGGIPAPDKAANPGTARVAKLGKDMISLEGNPVAIENVPYLFEDSGINKIQGSYYYSFCSNFSIPDEKIAELGYDRGEILVMKSDKPMGPFTLQGSILKNPGYFFGQGGNNHHCMFTFHDQLYMSYHARLLEERMGVLHSYRSTNLNLVKVEEDGRIAPIEGTKEGVKQLKYVNPYETQKAVTMASMAGIQTTQFGECAISCGSGDMIVSGISDGSWVEVRGVDFGKETAKELQVSLCKAGSGAIYVCLDNPDSEPVCKVLVSGQNDEKLSVLYGSVNKEILGVHDVFFVFEGEGYQVYDWKCQ